MDFITLLQDKAFKRYHLHAVRDTDTQQYKIASYNTGNDDDFFHDLALDLSLPIERKKFTFTFLRDDFKGFKNTSVQSLIKLNPSWEQFDNIFHSFYKNIPLNDLLNAVYVKSNPFGNTITKSLYQPYIIYFLKQDFSHQDMTPSDFLQTLKFNFHVTENNYPELKETLYTFLKNHAFQVKNKIRNGYSGHIDNEVKKFENSLYDSIHRFIKLEDMKNFNEFWPRILIKSSSDKMITTVNNTFVFDLSHSYLSDTYPQITNETLAHKTCHFIKNIINGNLEDYMTASIIHQDCAISRFVIEFKQSLNKQHLPDIFDSIVQIQEKTNQFTENYLRTEYRTVFEQGIDCLKKQISYLNLSDKMPEKNMKEQKRKI